MTLGNPIATVVAVIGVAYARTAAGELRALKPGDVLLEGEVLITPEGSSVELATYEGQLISQRTAGELPMLPAQLAAAEGGESTLAPETLEQILQTLAEGGDLTDLLEATAAGPGAGTPGNEGSGIVQLGRVVEQIDPASLWDIPPRAPEEPVIVNEFGGLEPETIDGEHILIRTDPVRALETDDPLLIDLAASIGVAISDPDGNERLQALSISFDRLPAGTTAIGDAVLVGNVLTVTLDAEGNLPPSFGILLPADYSTAGLADTPINSGAPIVYTVSAVSNEGSDSASSTLIVEVEEDLQPFADELGEGWTVDYTEDAASVPLGLGPLLPAITDADHSEQYARISLTFDQLPDGTRVSAGTLDGNQWQGTPADLEDLSLILPADFAGSLTGLLQVTSDEGGATGVQLPIRIQGTATEDIQLTATAVQGQETDAAVIVDLADAVQVAITDADGSEQMQTLVISFSHLPANTEAYGAASLVGTLLTVQLEPGGTLPESFGIRLPADYATAGVPGSILNDGAPIGYSVLAVSNEGLDSAAANIALAVEEDLQLQVTPEVLAEDSGPEGVGAVIDLNDNIHALVTDADTSEQLTAIRITLSQVPAGADMSGWTELGAGRWSFTWEPDDGPLVVPSFEVPEHYNTAAGAILASVQATTDEGGDQTLGFSITVTPVNDVPELIGEAREAVDEAALPSGSQRGVEAGTATTRVSGMLAISDVDGDSLTIRVGGEPVGVYDPLGPRTLLGTVAGDYGMLALYSDGYWTYRLLAAVPHDADGTPFELFSVTVNDGQVDSAAVSLRVDIHNDQPLTFTLNTVLFNLEGMSATAPFARYGADDGSGAVVQLAAAESAEGVVQATARYADGSTETLALTSAGAPVLSSFDPLSGVLTAYVAGAADTDGRYTPGVDTPVFTLTTDALAGVYRVDLLQPLDVSEAIPFDVTDTHGGGHKPNAFASKADDQPSLWMTAGGDNVNWNANGFGVGEPLDIVSGETFVITTMSADWGIPGSDDGSGGTYPLQDAQGNEIDIDAFEQITQARLGIVAKNGAPVEATLTYQLFVHTDTLGDPDTYADQRVAVGDPVTVTLAAGESLLIQSDDAFDTIELTPTGDSAFLVSDFSLYQQSDLHDLAIDFTGTITDADTDSLPIAFSVDFDGTGSPLEGGDEGDLLQGSGGDDQLVAGLGDDILIGGAGNDTLIGDIEELAGDLGSDSFHWEADDQGSVGSPAIDTIRDFDISVENQAIVSGDVLDLSDLLDAEQPSSAELQNFLYFEESGGNTVLHISTSGAFVPGDVDTGLADQQIVLEGVELLSLLDAAEQQALIDSLLAAGKLITE